MLLRCFSCTCWRQLNNLQRECDHLMVRHLSAAKLSNDNYIVKTNSTLGSGADGHVIRGIVSVGDRQGEWHALKFLLESAYSADREILTLKRVSPHPNIISLVGVFRANKQLVLAVPELDCSLRDYLGRRGGAASSSVSLRVSRLADCGRSLTQDVCGALRHQASKHSG